MKREADGWYAVLSCEVAAEPLSATGQAIGLDVGLKNLVTTSDGEVLGNLAPLKAAEKKFGVRSNFARSLIKKFI